MQTNHHIRACEEAIEQRLAAEEVELARLKDVVAANGDHDEQLANLHFLERECWARVGTGALTAVEADEAIEAYCNWIEHGQSFMEADHDPAA